MTTRQQVTYGVDFFEIDQSVQSCTPIHVQTVQTDTDYARQKTLSLCSQAVVNSTGHHRISYGMDLFNMDQSAQTCTPIHIQTDRSDTNDASKKETISLFYQTVVNMTSLQQITI